MTNTNTPNLEVNYSKKANEGHPSYYLTRTDDCPLDADDIFVCAAGINIHIGKRTIVLTAPQLRELYELTQELAE